MTGLLMCMWLSCTNPHLGNINMLYPDNIVLQKDIYQDMDFRVYDRYRIKKGGAWFACFEPNNLPNDIFY